MILLLFQSSWMPSFMVFIEFNLIVNCVKTITFVMKFVIQPDTDISACLVHYQMDNKTITCSKCASLSSQNVTVTFH